MRVSTNSFSSPGHILAQHAWMRDLARETGLRVREPLRTPSGADLAVVGSAGRDFHVVAAHWLDGEEVGECAVAHGHALGRAMAVMHSHAETWTMPAGGRLSDFADPLMGEEDRLRPAYAGRPDDLAVVDWAFRRCQAAMSAAAQRSRPTVIHGDLHGATVVAYGSLAVLDFGDCGLVVARPVRTSKASSRHVSSSWPTTCS